MAISNLDTEPKIHRATGNAGDRLRRWPTDRAREASFRLSELLAQLAPLPQASGFLGVCEDGLPLLLDFRNPSPGALLVVGDQACSNRNLLRTLMASLISLNTPAEVQVNLVTNSMEAYEEMVSVPGLLQVTDAHSPRMPDLIWQYVHRASRHQAGRAAHGVHLLVLDDLETATAQLDQDSLRALIWLVESGALAGNWVVAGFAADQFRQIDDRLFHAFATRLVGAVPSHRFAAYLSGLPDHITGSLVPGAQYCTVVKGELVRFWLPEYDYDGRPPGWMVQGVTR